MDQRPYGSKGSHLDLMQEASLLAAIRGDDRPLQIAQAVLGVLPVLSVDTSMHGEPLFYLLDFIPGGIGRLRSIAGNGQVGSSEGKTQRFIQRVLLQHSHRQSAGKCVSGAGDINYLGRHRRNVGDQAGINEYATTIRQLDAGCCDTPASAGDCQQ